MVAKPWTGKISAASTDTVLLKRGYHENAAGFSERSAISRAVWAVLTSCKPKTITAEIPMSLSMSFTAYDDGVVAEAVGEAAGWVAAPPVHSGDDRCQERRDSGMPPSLSG